MFSTEVASPLYLKQGNKKTYIGLYIIEQHSGHTRVVISFTQYPGLERLVRDNLERLKM
jgi:hypothetical protein